MVGSAVYIMSGQYSGKREAQCLNEAGKPDLPVSGPQLCEEDRENRGGIEKSQTREECACIYQQDGKVPPKMKGGECRRPLCRILLCFDHIDRSLKPCATPPLLSSFLPEEELFAGSG